MEVWQEIAKNAERGAERLAAFLAWVFLSDKMQKHRSMGCEQKV